MYLYDWLYKNNKDTHTQRKITWDKHLLINRFENAVNGDSDTNSLSELKDKLLECHAPMILLAIVEHRIEVLNNG